MMLSLFYLKAEREIDGVFWGGLGFVGIGHYC